ncbi:hypothetical protein CR513_42454, partial [Mucuna pruriens]
MKFRTPITVRSMPPSGRPSLYGRNLLEAITKANAAFSIFWYRNSAPCSTLLMKYISRWLPSCSCTKTALTVASDTEIYKCKGIPSTGRVNTGGDANMALNLRKASSHSSVHTKFLAFFRVLKIGLAVSADREMNRDKAVIRPISCCTSLTF